MKGERSAAINPAELGLGKGQPQRASAASRRTAHSPRVGMGAMPGAPTPRNNVNDSGFFSVKMLVINPRGKNVNGAADV